MNQLFKVPSIFSQVSSDVQSHKTRKQVSFVKQMNLGFLDLALED